MNSCLDAGRRLRAVNGLLIPIARKSFIKSNIVS